MLKFSKFARVIRSVWRFDACKLVAQEVNQLAGLKIGGIASLETFESGELVQDLAKDIACLLLRHESASYLLLPRGSRQRGNTVLIDGRPLLGGIGEVKHGTWVTLALGTARERLWLSAEGPAYLDRAGPGEHDAMTLDRTVAGETVVRCACGAAFEARTWSELRRCCNCSYVEDGIYHEVPSAAFMTAGSHS